MPRLGLLAATLLATLLATAPPAPAAAGTVPGEIIVRYKGSAGGSERAEARRAARVSLKETLRSGDTQVVETEQGQDTADALATLRRDPRVKHAIPNRVYQASAASEDAEFGKLWGLHNTGQVVDTVAGKLDADIDAPEAWDIFHSAPDTVVAVVDTGVRTDHPDLVDNLWVNDDAPGGGDQDGNGHADDTHGWDFIDNDGDVNDLDGHGTHVAGTIAAQGDNGIGVSGVARDAQIMPVRVLDENGSGDGVAIDKGFRYAAEQGARVVNASLGAPGGAADKAYYDDLFDDYLGTLFVIAAGNSGTNNDSAETYPCNSSAPNVICVAATDSGDALADFSNYGAGTVDLAAPGVSILSSVPRWAGVGFADDFETQLDGWTLGGNTFNGVQNGWDTFSDGWYNGGTDAFLSEKPASGDYSFRRSEQMTAAPANAYVLAGQRGCVAAWDHFYDYDEGRDHLYVQTSPASPQNWTNRQTYTGTNDGVEARKLNLKADGSSVRVRFRMVADGTLGPKGSYYGSMIDNFRVQCTQVPDPIQSYEFFRGTSMAAPHVAGVATLLFGARPDASPDDVRGWLEASGDPLGVLAGKTVTGRRLNAYNALLAAGAASLVTTGGVDAVTTTGATLRGTINPDGVPTEYRFDYGTAPGAPTSQTPTVPAGGGGLALPVARAITGLTADTTYHYRLVAIQGGVETPGQERSFKTAPLPAKVPPTLTLAPASAVGTTVATLAGTVNPNGRQTTALLEFGTVSGTYGSQTNSVDVGAGSAPEALTVELTGLRPATRYFYRLRASNTDGESVSPERSFTTLAAPVVTPPTGVNVPPTSPPVSPPPNGTPPTPRVSLVCKLSRTRRVGCKAGATAAVRVSVRVTRAGRLYARGTAPSLKKGRALRMRTLRRAKRGRYKLQITVTHGGVKTTLTRTIRL